MPQELQLPDGRILVLPDNMTLDQRAALRGKLGATYADIKTGAGMEQRAQQQAKQSLKDRVQSMPLTATAPRPPGGGEEAMLAEGAPPAAAGLGAVGTFAEGAQNPWAVARGVAGGAAGAYGGGKTGEYLFGKPGKVVGATVGGVAGGYLGASGMPLPGKYGTLLDRMGTGGPARTGAASEAPGATGDVSGALADRIAAERGATQLIRTPEDWAASDVRGTAAEAATQAARPQSRLEGMIRSGRGQRPQLTNEELQYLAKTGKLPGD